MVARVCKVNELFFACFCELLLSVRVCSFPTSTSTHRSESDGDAATVRFTSDSAAVVKRACLARRSKTNQDCCYCLEAKVYMYYYVIQGSLRKDMLLIIAAGFVSF